jgi:acid phosphatase (class A)
MKSLLLGAAGAVAMLMASAVAAAPPPTDGYLNLAPLGYATPPAPTDPLALELDLVQVRAAHPSPTAIQWQEAASDADAYNAPDIVRRFDDATGELLYEADRPLLVAMLRRIIIDTGAYAGEVKAVNPRPRPYVEDPSITPCNTHFLAGSEQRSYPSGHAMNGYVVALVLADVFPARRQPILARGARYGDNRVACGVHHPTDVEAGRLLGIAYYHRLSALPAFEDDLRCAEAEEALATSKTPMPAACAGRRLTIMKSLAAPKATTPNAANLF